MVALSFGGCMSDEFISKVADLIGRIGYCFVVGAVIGLIFGSANHPVESLGAPIFVMLLIEFLG